MIKTTRQLKDKINNISGGNPNKAQTLFRNYMMERFLERVSLSKYKNNFILKGGMLVASIVGLDMRATMDIDTTVKSLPLNKDKSMEIIKEIADYPLDDNVIFEINSAEEIMEEHEYSGIRIKLDAYFEKSKQPIKIDISTGDVITPCAVTYEYPLMVEDRTISVLSYNIETTLAEKLETIMSRGTTNTRMRDFYDIYMISENHNVDIDDLCSAFLATSRNRNSNNLIEDIFEIIDEISQDKAMQNNWENYINSNYYISELDWNEVVDSVRNLVTEFLDISENEDFIMS